jgi:hypothetical protein
MKYRLIVLLILGLTGTRVLAQDTLPLPNPLPANVGDLKFDPKTDDPHFQICDPDYIIQYYGTGTGYKGGKKEIRNYLIQHFKYEAAFSAISGYITIRFIVNCKGQAGWFRIKQVDQHYQHANFNKRMVDQLFDLTKKLNGWIPGNVNGVNCDTYYYLNFKLLKGYLKDITP